MTTPRAGDPLEYVERRDGETVKHTGTVWSDGPIPSTVWAQPDSDPHNPVLVRIPTPARAKRGEQPALDADLDATWQRDTVRRCDNLRRHGAIYRTRRPLGTYGSRDMWEYVQHADPHCDSAANLTQERSDRTLAEVLDVLLNRYTGRPPKLCSRCILLDRNAPIGAAS